MAEHIMLTVLPDYEKVLGDTVSDLYCPWEQTPVLQLANFLVDSYDNLTQIRSEKITFHCYKSLFKLLHYAQQGQTISFRCYHRRTNPIWMDSFSTSCFFSRSSAIVDITNTFQKGFIFTAVSFSDIEFRNADPLITFVVQIK